MGPVTVTNQRSEIKTRRGISFALTAVLLALLVFSVLLQVWFLPAEVGAVGVVFPETKPIAVPSIVWSVIAIACWQAVAVMCLRIGMLRRRHRFNAAAYGWLRAIVGCLLAYIILAVAAFIALNAMGFTTPGVMLGLIGTGLIAVIIVASLLLFLGTRR
jgi:hypothetical protein